MGSLRSYHDRVLSKSLNQKPARKMGVEGISSKSVATRVEPGRRAIKTASLPDCDLMEQFLWGGH